MEILVRIGVNLSKVLIFLKTSGTIQKLGEVKVATTKYYR